MSSSLGLLRRMSFFAALLSIVMAASISSAYAQEQTLTFDIPAQPLSTALIEFSRQSDVVVVADPVLVNGRQAPAVSGSLTPDEAINRLLSGSGVTATRRADRSYVLSGSAAPPARAGGTSGSSNLEEILVTGTRIRNVPNNTLPVTVLDRDFIESSGASSTPDLLESLPQNFALATQSGVNVPGVSGSVIQGSAINLRGIGEGTTLTLINGRRPPAGFLGRATDIASLPLSAIERVEILTDGASAVYGSDAVGGVVNFILRHDFEGSETGLRAGAADDVNEYRFSQALGGAWQSGNALVSLEYYERDLLRSSDRDFVPSSATVGSLLPKDENLSVVLTTRQEVSSSAELFLEALYTDRDSYNESGSIAFSESADVQNPQLNVTGGAKFILSNEWEIEGSGGYGSNDAELVQSSSFGTLETDTLFEIEAAEIKGDGPLFGLFGGRARLALGTAWRDEAFEFTQSFGGASVTQAFDQTVYSAFAEMLFPLLGDSTSSDRGQRLELSLAGRYDDYSNFGSSFDPRFGIAWEPLSGLRFRGSFGTSYVAPKLLDYDVTFNAASVQTAADPEAPGGTSRQLWVFGTDVAALAPQEAETWSFGVDFTPEALPNLKLGLNYYDIKYDDRIANPPPTGVIISNPSSFGDLIVREPSIDEVNDAVEVGASVGRFFDCEFDPIACSPDPNFDPSSIDVIIDARRRNLSLTETNGIDLSMQYELKSDVGDFQFAVNATHILSLDQQVTTSSEPFDTVDTVYNPPDWRARASLGFARGAVASNVIVNYTDSYSDNRVLPLAPVDSYTTVDGRIAYAFGDRATGGFLSGLTLSVTVQNILDQDPPATAVIVPESDMGFDPTNANPLGRLIAIELVKIW